VTRVEEVVVERAVHDARRPHRVLWTGLVVILAALIATGAAVLTLYGSVSDLTEEANDNARAAQTLARQVEGLGGTPAVQPPVPGERGVPGEPGPPGRDGRDGVTPTCVSEPSQCRGEPGEPGPPGRDGVDGRAGQDGTNGSDGQPGQPGRDGVDGRPPASWTWVDGDGRTQSCTRDEGSPDSAPTYTCTAPSTGPPGTTTSSPPLQRIGG
jgi:hypothetical protein